MFEFFYNGKWQKVLNVYMGKHIDMLSVTMQPDDHLIVTLYKRDLDGGTYQDVFKKYMRVVE